MMEDFAVQAFIAVLFTAVGALGATVYHKFRQEQADAARHDRRTEREFAPVLARVRPFIDAHNAALADAPEWWRATTAESADPGMFLPPAGYLAELNMNSSGWPVNTSPAAAIEAVTAGAEPAPVGRVHVDLDFNPADVDFETYVHGYGNYLRHQAALAVADPDATGVIPLRQIEGAGR